MQNLLRTYRKKTGMKIEDISYLLEMPNGSYLSRCERGLKKPSLEIIFAYHLIFKVSIEKLFENEMKRTLKKINGNIQPLIQFLKAHRKISQVETRISNLYSLQRLISKEI